MSNSLQPHGLQHSRFPWQSPTPGAYSNSCPLHRWCHPTISSSVVRFSSCLQPLPSTFPSIRFFSNESVLHVRWPKYWRWSFSISPSNEHPGLISFRIDWLDLLAVQGTLKQLLQHHSSEASILRCSAFFIVQLSHPYVTTGKTTALTSWTFVGKVMSLLFNMLSRLAIAFLPRSKHLLISWLQSPSAVVLVFKKIKSLTVSIVSPSICHEVMGGAMTLVFWMLSFKPTFSLSSFTFIKRLFSSLSLSAKSFGVVNKAKVDILLELSCFFSGPANVGNLISGSSAFSKSILNIWKFTVHVLLKPGLENFEYYFACVWDDCSCAVVWIFFGLPFFGIGMKTDLFQSCDHCWVFQIFWHIECSTFTASSFKI